jgi:hypothetical protein
MAQLTGRAHGFANFRKRAKQNTDSFIATDSISCMLNLDSDWKASSIPLQLKKSPFMLAVDISRSHIGRGNHVGGRIGARAVFLCFLSPKCSFICLHYLNWGNGKRFRLFRRCVHYFYAVGNWPIFIVILVYLARLLP